MGKINFANSGGIFEKLLLKGKTHFSQKEIVSLTNRVILVVADLTTF